jgi:hypothetical protein
MSKFALVAQVAGLLGQVLKHVSDHTTDRVLHDEEGVQLDRTLHALISASEVNNSPYCDQRAICYRYIFTASHEVDPGFDTLQCSYSAP